MAVRQLAPPVAELYGPGRMVIIYTAGAIGGFALSSFAGAFLPNLLFLRGARFTVGASASICGLIGALVYYGRRSGSRHISSQAWSLAMGQALFGVFMPFIDNYAHLGGFGGGYLAARLLDPLKPERIDHLLAALVCLALSILRGRRIVHQHPQNPGLNPPGNRIQFGHLDLRGRGYRFPMADCVTNG